MQLWNRIRYDGTWDLYTNGHVPGDLLVRFYTHPTSEAVMVGSSYSYGDYFWDS